MPIALICGQGRKCRSHAKTHKLLKLRKMQVAAGAVGLTVAKLSEAECFAEAGLTDLLIAYPLVGPIKQRRLFNLLERAHITTVLDHPDIAEGLSKAAVEFGRDLPVLIDVDTGMHRTGVLYLMKQWQNWPSRFQPALTRLAGILTHEGQAIMAESQEQMRATSLTPVKPWFAPPR
ncbi:MAG: alanine racemase [Anaerolineae bacterium]